MQDLLFTVDKIKTKNDSVFELKLKASEPLPSMHAGQFIHLKIPENGMYLRRPFCLYKWDKKSITLLIAKVGKGSQFLSTLKKKQQLLGILPIGNGFSLKPHQKRIALIGGGVGVAPLRSVPESLLGRKKDFVVIVGGLIIPVKNTVKGTEVRAYLGFASKDKILAEKEFKEVCERVTVSTDDGSKGFKGNAVQAFREEYQKGFIPDVVLACGSHGLIKAVQAMCRELGLEGYMSGEERMGCGVGACLVCTCAVQEGGEVRHKRACVDGPVFNLEDLVL